MAVAIAAALAGPAYAQGLPVGIPMGEPKKEKPVDPIKENEYRSAIGGLPTAKSVDPWGSVRETKPASTAPAKKTPPAEKSAHAAKKTSTPAKTGDTTKKTN
jgi:hypothetical protein